MTAHHDLSAAPPERTYINVAALEADLAEAEQGARAALAELAAVEAAAPPPVERMAATLGNKLRLALGDRYNAVSLPQTIARVHTLTADARAALEQARAWALEVEQARGALVAALDADPAVRKGRAALASAHKGAAALAARLRELRRDLAALGERPASAEQAGAWAQQRAALQGELSAVEGLEADARRPIPGAQEALTAAEGAVLARLQEAAAGEVEAARKAWAAEQARVNREGAARVAGAERAAARVKTAQRTLQKGA